MKTAGRFLLLIVLCVPLALFAKEQKLTMIHTNDMHSHFLGFPPSIDYTPQVTGDDATRGGWARIKTVITKTKADRGNPVLVVDCGRFPDGHAVPHGQPREGDGAAGSCVTWDMTW